MPTNLPPEYFDAEKRFKQASTPAEKVTALEALLAIIPKHKGTDKLRADFKKRLSKLKEEAIASKSKKGGRFDLYTVEGAGAAQIALVGLPNAGKSSILDCLTHANPVIAAYPLSTSLPLSGMMPFEDIQIQLVDLPPIGNESTDGWVSGLIRQADAIILIVDLSEDPVISVELLMETLKSWNIHLESISQKANVQGAGQVFQISKRVLLSGNKLDLPDAEGGLDELKVRYEKIYPFIGVSAEKKKNMEELKRATFGLSNIIRAYTKEPGHKADLSKPFTLKRGSTVLDLCKEIHKDFLIQLKYARVWGAARFEGQKVQKEYILQDKDVVEIHI